MYPSRVCGLASCCIALALLTSPRPCTGQEETGFRHARIVADRYEFDENRNLITASGSVVVTIDGARLTTDSVICLLRDDRLAVSSLEAVGAVEFSRRAEGYDLRAVCEGLIFEADEAGGRRAVFDKARVEITRLRQDSWEAEGHKATIIAVADRIELMERREGDKEPQRVLTIERGWLTTCDRPNPHYRIRAREITVSDDDFVFAKSAGVQLGSVRLPSIPNVRFNLRDAGRTSLFPVIGANSASGPFLRWYFNLAARPNALRLAVQASQKRSPSWGFEGVWGRNPKLFWAVATRQDTSNARKRGLTVSRNPQVGLKFEIGQLLGATADWGRFREFPGGTESERTRLRLQLNPVRLLELGKLTLLASGSATRAWYEGRYDYRASNLNLHSRFHLGRGNSLMLGYVIGSTNRDTPFFFDDLDILRELQGGFTCVSRAGTVDFVARYDLDARSFFAYRIGLSISYHCLRPRVSYDSRDREFSVEMSLAGF